MNTGTIWETLSTASNATEQLGELVGSNIRGGEVIELVSDLGGGKTTFVRGLARGMGSTDHVASPSFTIAREYSVKGQSFHKLIHFDFHRLDDGGLMKHELAEFIEDPKNVVVIEWAEAVKDVLPIERLTVEIKHEADDQRKLIFKAPNSLSYLLKGIKNVDTNN